GQDREALEDLRQQLAEAGLVPAAQRIAPQAQVLLHGEPGEDLAALGDVAHAEEDPVLGLDRCDVAPAEADPAAPGRHDAGDDLHGHALASAVQTEDARDLTRAYGQVDPVEHGRRAEAGSNVLELEQRR